MRIVNPHAPDFLNKGDTRFRTLQNVIDNTFKKLRSEGVGCSAKHTEILTKEEERQLWESGAIGTSTPRALLSCLFLEWQELLPVGTPRTQEFEAKAIP